MYQLYSGYKRFGSISAEAIESVFKRFSTDSKKLILTVLIDNKEYEFNIIDSADCLVARNILYYHSNQTLRKVRIQIYGHIDLHTWIFKGGSNNVQYIKRDKENNVVSVF